MTKPMQAINGHGHAPTIEAPPIVTKEQIEAWQRQQQALEQQAMQDCIAQLTQMAARAGFQIVAMPQFTPDGRTTAVWGVTLITK